MSKLRLFFVIILLPLGFFQCSDEHPVPDVYVYFEIRLDLPQYQDLMIPTNSVYIPNEGYNGIIVTNIEGIVGSGESYAAYDATCTYDPEVPGAVVEENDYFGTCKVCGSKFNLVYNNVESGPAGLPLKKYTARYNPNQNLLIITN
jgi:Rieske Fe-S protein